MKALRYGAWVVVLAIAGLVHVQSAKTQEAGHASDRERLIGAWHLEHIDSPEPEGKPSDNPQPKGMLIYTREGPMSVHLMYHKTATRSPDGSEPRWENYLDGLSQQSGEWQLRVLAASVVRDVFHDGRTQSQAGGSVIPAPMSPTFH